MEPISLMIQTKPKVKSSLVLFQGKDYLKEFNIFMCRKNENKLLLEERSYILAPIDSQYENWHFLLNSFLSHVYYISTVPFCNFLPMKQMPGWCDIACSLAVGSAPCRQGKAAGMTMHYYLCHLFVYQGYPFSPYISPIYLFMFS